MSIDAKRAYQRRKSDSHLADLPTASSGERMTILRAALYALDDFDKLDRLAALHFDEGKITANEAGQLMVVMYQHVNDPMLRCARVLELFRLAKASNGQPVVLLGGSAPITALRLFRGATESGKRGLSWSTSASVAEKFVKPPEGRLWTCIALPDHVLAIPGNMGEYEIIVDPELIPEPTELLLP